MENRNLSIKIKKTTSWFVYYLLQYCDYRGIVGCFSYVLVNHFAPKNLHKTRLLFIFFLFGKPQCVSCVLIILHTPEPSLFFLEKILYTFTKKIYIAFIHFTYKSVYLKCISQQVIMNIKET